MPDLNEIEESLKEYNPQTNYSEILTSLIKIKAEKKSKKGDSK